MTARDNATAYADRILHGITPDAAFVSLLGQLDISLMIAVRHGAIVTLGCEGTAPTVSCTPFENPMGIAWDGKLLAIGGRRNISVFVPSTRLAAHLPGKEGLHDVVFIPSALYRTGECMVHEMVTDGRSVLFTNTMFSCLARADGTQSFIPMWKPLFVTELMAEDRCHLNGFATEDKRIRYATAFAPTNTRQGFRDLPVDCGIVMDVERNEVAVAGLVRPHSPRLFDGRLYVLNSGCGEVLRIDPAGRQSETLAVLPGFTRGLRRHGPVLFVGLSMLRDSSLALGLPLVERKRRLMVGIAALDLETGRVIATQKLPREVGEVFDFVVMPGVRRPLLFDPTLDAPLVAVETPDMSFLMAASQIATPWASPPQQSPSVN
jgi:uncharacterized protein (TIGR03032 family)